MNKILVGWITVFFVAVTIGLIVKHDQLWQLTGVIANIWAAALFIIDEC